jgi:hypothetical protein
MSHIGICTVSRPGNEPRGVVRRCAGDVGYTGDRPAVGGSDGQSDTTHRPKPHRTFRLACSERVHYANASRMGSSILRLRMCRVPCKHHLFGGLVHHFVAFNLRPIHTYHAVLMPCRSAEALDCVFPISFTQCDRVWFTHTMSFQCRSPAMPRRCLSENDLSRPRQCRGKVAAGWRHGNGMVCVNWHRPFRDGMLATCQLSASFCYHAEFQEVFFYQKHTNLSCRWKNKQRKQSNDCDGQWEAYNFGARTWVLV